VIDSVSSVNLSTDAQLSKEPTIHDIAQLARVSVGTVSNVLNGRQTVGEDLALRVNVAANKLGYRRNLNAASLRSNQTDTIAVAVPNIENAFFAEIVSMLELLASPIVGRCYFLRRARTKNARVGRSTTSFPVGSTA
jgi:hypothetical protein